MTVSDIAFLINSMETSLFKPLDMLRILGLVIVSYSLRSSTLKQSLCMHCEKILFLSSKTNVRGSPFLKNSGYCKKYDCCCLSSTPLREKFILCPNLLNALPNTAMTSCCSANKLAKVHVYLYTGEHVFERAEIKRSANANAKLQQVSVQDENETIGIMHEI